MMNPEFKHPPKVQEAFLHYVNAHRTYHPVHHFNEQILFCTGYDSDGFPGRYYHQYNREYNPEKDPRNYNPLYTIGGFFPASSWVNFRWVGDHYEPAFIRIIGEVQHLNDSGCLPIGDQMTVNLVNSWQISGDFELAGRELDFAYSQDGTRLMEVNLDGKPINPANAEEHGLIIPDSFDIAHFTQVLFHEQTVADPINAPIELDKSWILGDLLKASKISWQR